MLCVKLKTLLHSTLDTG